VNETTGDSISVLLFSELFIEDMIIMVRGIRTVSITQLSDTPSLQAVLCAYLCG